MFISRELEPLLKKGLSSGKVIVLFGARQTGKTTLVRHILKADDVNSLRATSSYTFRSKIKGVPHASMCTPCF